MSTPEKPLSPRPGTAAVKENYVTFNDKTRGKAPQPNYLRRLKLYQRYPRTCIFGFGIMTFCIVYSAQIYYFFRDPTIELPKWRTQWYSERLTGKTKSEQYWEAKAKQEEDYQRMLAKKKELDEKRAARDRAQVEAIEAMKTTPVQTS